MSVECNNLTNAKMAKQVTKFARNAKSNTTIDRSAQQNGKFKTKKTQLIAMLQTKGGATIAMISEALGWQQHTSRAALSGLRKAGHKIEVIKPDNGRACYYCINKSVTTK